ncbi:radical SAM protein [Methanothrix thermoacetophila]|uniref:Radical SAM domain protein n=1 Tax=Methanothrix thermoacetophila (strain DSM 6194 / JCM 14653 / NBRC 101360 / PT) TaxID=349307 RepID=A0B8X3_METTP|nr:Radical SAM domain protein [Methanothrix thermoacetophila PT]
MAVYNRMPPEELQSRAEEAIRRLEHCEICPRRCGVNRIEGELGFCRTGRLAKVSSAGPHYGEEPPLVGYHGSGTIFFAGCNLACVFCQNYEISQLDMGVEVTAERLAGIMMHLQLTGCHNINLVTPTHVVPQILEALVIASEMGLSIPLVYNSGGYDSVDTLRLLDGIVDIYMPDAKYGSDEMAMRYSNAPGYVGVMKAAIKEMHRQVGDLVIENGIAVRGLLVRHLVLPDNLAGTDEVVRFISELSKNTYINIMDQYRPEYRADRYRELSRRITLSEYREALRLARAAGLSRGLEDI